ncbi:MAG TPA: amidohydrolase family protein [Pseudolabrys sp.]|nr:amidohydrolase family protein [Pseudolabrys sp.]
MVAAKPILGVTPTPLSFEVPRGACDCHTHVFGPIEKFPFSSKRLYTPGDASIGDLEALHRAFHIDRVVVVHPSPYGADNAVTVDAVRKLGPRARGVAVIDDKTSDAELDDMRKAGIRGVRVNLESHGESDPAVAGTYLQQAAERVAPLGWHVQTYTNLSILAALHDTIMALPTTLVVDHFGRPKAAHGTAQPGFEQLLALLRSGKVYVKISAPYRISLEPHYPDAAPIARVMIDANPDRVVWGSDWPHPGAAKRDPAVIEPFRQEDNGEALNRLAGWTKDRTELQKILVDNPARLYQF